MDHHYRVETFLAGKIKTRSIRREKRGNKKVGENEGHG